MPRISVVVPVHDEARKLASLLRALEHQTLALSDFEVIVADDGSDPPIRELEYIALNERVIRLPRANSYAARNQGALLARSPFIAFCDADCRPDRGWLENGLAMLRRSDLVAGDVRPQMPLLPTCWTLLDLGCYHDQRALVPSERAVTANLLVSHAMFMSLGGFDASLPSGGDFDFVQRCVARGATLAYSARCVVRHPTRDTAASHLRKLWTDDVCGSASRRLEPAPPRYTVHLARPFRIHLSGHLHLISWQP